MQNGNAKFKIFGKTRGFSLLDVIFAIGIILVGLIAIMGLFRYVILAGRLSADRFVAANLAQEGIEIIRSIRDTNWIEPNGGPPYAFNGLDDSGSNFYEVDYKTDEWVPVFTTVTDENSARYLALDTDDFYAYDASGETTKFKRLISIESIESGNGRKIVSRVFWTMLGVPYNITIEDRLYNWLQ